MHIKMEKIKNKLFYIIVYISFFPLWKKTLYFFNVQRRWDGEKSTKKLKLPFNSIKQSIFLVKMVVIAFLSNKTNN